MLPQLSFINKTTFSLILSINFILSEVQGLYNNILNSFCNKPYSEEYGVVGEHALWDKICQELGRKCLVKFCDSTLLPSSTAC